MKNYKILRFLDRFEKIFINIGVEYHIMRRIIQVKLTMDGRRVPTIIGQSAKKKNNGNNEKNSFLSSLWIYAFFGLFLIPIVLIGDNYIYQMSIFFGALFFMIMSTLISDFSSVLLDIRDKNIIMTKPVSNITVSMAKGIHVFIYMFYLTISLSGGVLVASLFRHGFLYFVVLILQIVLMDLFIIVITTLFYTFILKYFDGEKLKDIINYVQIGLSLLITVGYQLVGRLFNIIDLDFVFQPRWWQYFIPPIWFAGPFEVLLHKDFNSSFVIFSILALMIPIIAIIIYIKLIPTFERNLEKLNYHDQRNEKKKNNKFNKFISSIICSNREERIYYNFASRMMLNEREFKLKVYPALGFSIIFPYIFIFNQLQWASISTISQGKGFLNLYFSGFMIPSILLMLKHSGNYKGSWIYKVMPIEKSKPIFTGTIKAFIIKLLVPICLINYVIFLYIFGLRIGIDLVAIFLNFILYIIVSFSFSKKSIPFSKSFEAVNQSQGYKIIPMIFIGGIMALIHYLTTLVVFGVLIYVIVLIIIIFITWNKVFNVSWDKISYSYDKE